MKMRKHDVRVTQGQVRIENVDLAARRRGYAVYIIYTETKYPEASVSWGPDSQPAVHLNASEHSLHADRDKPASYVELPTYTTGWEIIAQDLGRYSIQVAAYKRRNLLKKIWAR